MRLAMCDDNRWILEGFEKVIAGMGYGSDLELSLFSDDSSLLAACRETSFDMVFMDIMLGEKNGIEVAKKVAGLLPTVRVVFVTAYVLDYAESIFDGIQPYGYLGKPVDIAKMKKYIDRAMREMEAMEQVMYVSIKGVDYRLLLSGVRYIESSGRQAYVHYGDEVVGGVYERLDVLADQLDGRFVRCHQSFIVNLDYVSSMDTDSFEVEGHSGGESVTIRISRNRIKEARQKYYDYKGRSQI